MPEWLQSPVVVFGLAIAAMFFGYFFGLFEGRGQGYKRRQKEEAEQKKAEPVPEPLPSASPVVSPDETPMLDVSKHKSGRLRLSLDGQRTDPSTLTTDQRKRLIEVLTLIRPWLEGSKSVQSPQEASPPAQPRPAPSPQAAPTPTASSSPQPPPAPRPPVPPPAVDENAPAASPQSIVAQIDSILHAQIADSPLAEKGIRLQESPEGGVLVWVGMDRFEGVEAVPDEQIKAAIRKAIAAWEDKYTPGL